MTDAIASVEFDYQTLVNNGKMNSSLGDIRIIENHCIRDYYVQMDTPSSGYATVWFQTNIRTDNTAIDTFMYYGNPSAGFDAEHLMDQPPTGVSRYSFEGANNTIIDSNNNYNATIVNQGTRNIVPSANDDLGNALQFDGSDDYAYIHDQYFDSIQELITGKSSVSQFNEKYTELSAFHDDIFTMVQVEGMEPNQELKTKAAQLTEYRSRLAVGELVSGSLTPFLEIGDKALLDTQPDLDKIDVGDLIVFLQDGRRIMHFVNRKYMRDGEIYFETTGLNQDPDDWEVRVEDIEAKALISEEAFRLLNELEQYREFDSEFCFYSVFGLPITPKGRLSSIKSTKQGAQIFANGIENKIKFHEREIANRLINLLNNDPQKFSKFNELKNLATIILNNGPDASGDFHLPTITYGIIGSIVGFSSQKFAAWNRGDRGISLKDLNNIWDLFNFFYSSTSFLSDVSSLFGGNQLPSGLTPSNQPGIFRIKLKKLFMSWENQIINFLVNNLNNPPIDISTRRVYSDILNNEIETDPFTNQKRFIRNIDNLIFDRLLEKLCGVDENVITRWKRRDFITPSIYQKINDYVSSFFGRYIGTQFSIFKIQLDGINRAPTSLTKQSVKEQILYYFKTGERLFSSLSHGRYPSLLFGKASYHRSKPLIKKYLMLLLDDPNFLTTIYSVLKSNHEIEKLKNSPSVEFDSLIDFFGMLYPTARPSPNPVTVLNTIYSMIFGKSFVSWHMIMKEAEDSNLDIDLTNGEWFLSVMNWKIDGNEWSGNIPLPCECKLCGFIYSTTWENLAHGSACPICTRKLRRNERVSGAMIESFLLQIKRFKEMNPNTEIEIIDVQKEPFVSRDPKKRPQGIFNIEDRHSPSGMDIDSMRFDYSVTLKINGEYFTYIFESDGGQHQNNGFGFLSYLGMTHTKYLPSDATLIKSKSRLSELKELINSYYADNDIIQRRFMAWERLIKRDSFENRLSTELYSGDGIMQNPYKFLIRIPTQNPSEGGLVDNERPKYIVKRIETLSGIDITLFGVNPSKLQNIDWDFVIASINSVYNLWRTSE